MKKIKGELGTMSTVKVLRDKPISKLEADYQSGKKLRPCPFCGGESEKNNMGFYSDGLSSGLFCVVRCKSCGVRSNLTKDRDVSESWNRRVQA